MVVARGWWEEDGGVCRLMDIEFQSREMKSSGDGWWRWLYNNMGRVMPLSCTFNNC
uniref:Macaca fascicularis brain cDNA, clone: QmoA-10673 n=1 Tax=Macaca fascicularis TaxID=9541 RepID=I7GN22_MACFA|nr:unnamed protein product [Macaca fascicularis]